MFNVLIDFQLSKKVVISKLGITFRMLTKKEKDSIHKKIEELYFNNKKTIDYYVKKYKTTNFEYILETKNLDSTLQSVILTCIKLHTSKFTFNTKKQINHIVEHIMIIEIKKEILSKYIEEKDYIKFVSNLINLYEVYLNDVNFKRLQCIDYSLILDYNILDFKNSDYISCLFINIIFSYSHNSKQSITLKKIEISEKFLRALAIFISKLKSNNNKDELNNFIMILDFFFSESDNLRARIIQRITIIETLLIKENQNIEQNFILKTGIVLKKYLNPGNNIVIHNLLQFCYEIRSCIVHGNEEKIIVSCNKLFQKDNRFKNLLSSSEKSISKKQDSIRFCDIILFIFTRAIIKCWVEDTSLINYMKEN